MSNESGMLVILSGPSGSGKDTILEEISKRDFSVQMSISMTTRAAREKEVDGVHYYFVDTDYFMKKAGDNQILEYAKYGINYYGTPKAPVDQWIEEGKTVILKIEVQGAKKIREMYSNVVTIFLMPPSMEVLEDRLRRRETDDEEDIKRRMVIAKEEIKRAKEYDYIVVNDLVDVAVSDIISIIRAEKLKSDRMKYCISEVIKC